MKQATPKKGPDPYLQQKIMSASPHQLVAYIYDAGIAACIQKDKERALRAVQELINALDFSKEEKVTGTFYQVYRHLMEQLRNDQFDTVRTALSDIRKSWVDAMKVY